MTFLFLAVLNTCYRCTSVKLEGNYFPLIQDRNFSFKIQRLQIFSICLRRINTFKIILVKIQNKHPQGRCLESILWLIIQLWFNYWVVSKQIFLLNRSLFSRCFENSVIGTKMAKDFVINTLFHKLPFSFKSLVSENKSRSFPLSWSLAFDLIRKKYYKYHNCHHDNPLCVWNFG